MGTGNTGGVSKTTTTATGAGTRVDVTLKLPQLQNLCKRDPTAYYDDYSTQIRKLHSELVLLQQHPNASSSNNNNNVIELIQFAAAVSSSSYKGKESDKIASMLIDMLGGSDISNIGDNNNSNNNNNYNNNNTITNITNNNINNIVLQLHKDIRKTCVSALILMRNKGVIEPLILIQLFFNIMSIIIIHDKNLRELLYKHIVNDIRNINKKGKRNDKLNKSIQTFLHRIVQQQQQQQQNNNTDDNENNNNIACKRAVDIVCELYRYRVWTDERTVAIIASAVECDNITIACRAMKFFLNIEEKMADDDNKKKENDYNTMNNSIDYHLHSKKTARRQRQTARAVKNRKRAIEKNKEGGDSEWLELTNPESSNNNKGSIETSKKLYPAIELLRNPQGLAETVFKRLRNTNSTSIKYENKLLMINFITRLIGNHELLLLPLYSYIQKYMNNNTRDVTAILAYTVQACHIHVPPNEIYGIIKTIAYNFITERCSEEQIAIGINAVRAICIRVPSIMSIDESNNNDNNSDSIDIEAFVRDIITFANHRDRSVSIAGKSFLNFVRDVHPTLLQGKHRGLKGTALHKNNIKPLRYGEEKVATGVDGADLLVEYEMKKALAKGKGNNNKKSVEKQDDYNDEGSGEWVNIEDSENDEEAPDLIKLDGNNHVDGVEEVAEGEEEEEEVDEENEDVEGGKEEEVDGGKEEEEAIIDVSKMSAEERDKLKQQVSSTRIFTAKDFERMRKLVEREKRARQDPREAARRKRAIARGEEFEALSGSDDSSDDTDNEDVAQVRIKGAVNPEDIMALATRKRQSKAEKLEKIIAGRNQFESKTRVGGSTNTEKKRKKNFLMSKFSKDARSKGRGKSSNNNNNNKRKKKQISGTHEAKKRRRKT